MLALNQNRRGIRQRGRGGTDFKMYVILPYIKSGPPLPPSLLFAKRGHLPPGLVSNVKKLIN
jgi:hypothetical protein